MYDRRKSPLRHAGSLKCLMFTFTFRFSPLQKYFTSLWLSLSLVVCLRSVYFLSPHSWLCRSDDNYVRVISDRASQRSYRNRRRRSLGGLKDEGKAGEGTETRSTAPPSDGEHPPPAHRVWWWWWRAFDGSKPRLCHLLTVLCEVSEDF